MSRAVDPEPLLLERRRARIAEVVDRRLRGLTLVLDQVHDPHNLAAVLRTAEGLGLQSVHVLESTAGFRPNPTVTQGADKWLDLCRHRDARGCADALRGAGFALYGSRLAAPTIDVEALPLDRPLALVFGNEHAGIGAALAAECDGFFTIPMFGFAQSFNVSVAAAIALATVRLARRRAGLPEGDLDPPAKTALRQRFYALALKQGKRLAASAPRASGTASGFTGDE